jgi:hypothetical protein
MIKTMMMKKTRRRRRSQTNKLMPQENQENRK